MKRVSLIIAIIASALTGCATVVTPVQPADQEPRITGKNVDQRLFEASENIELQKQLLSKLRNREPIYNVTPVTHNNNLDARPGSPNTIAPLKSPSSKVTVVTEKTPVTPVSPVSDLERNPKSSQLVKQIDWKKNSLNELSQNLSKALGYEFVLNQNGKKDLMIDFYIEKQDLKTVVEQLRKQIANQADIIIVGKNNTFNLIYR